MTILVRALLLLMSVALALAPGACYDALQAVGPGVKLATDADEVDISIGGTATIFAQVLDVNGGGVDGASVTFTRSDPSRLTWLDATLGSDAVTAITGSAAPSGVSARGVARARVGVPATAKTGDATVIAVLKGPADPASAITVKVTLHVTPGDGGSTSDASMGPGGAPGAGGAPGTGGTLQDAGTGGGAAGGTFPDVNGGMDP